MYNYDIGGQERKGEVNEGISEIPQNKTLLVEKLTDDPPLSPEIVTDLKNISEVFEHYKPQKEMEFDTAEGSSVNEVISFRSLADFGKSGIVNQSAYLNELNAQCQDLQKFVRQLKSNKILKSMLENKEAKASYIATIQALINELEQAEK
jgi:predicted component of type VI protein secretion system